MSKINSSNFLDKLSSGYTPYIIISVLVLIAYIKVFNFDFSGLDDKLLLIGNFDFLKQLSNIPEAFKTDAFIKGLNSPFYRPMQTVVFIIETQFMGVKPDTTIYHSMNLIVHIINSILVFVFLKKVQSNNTISLILSLIFAVNPLFVHSVAWIPALGDLLVATFIFASFINWIDYINKNNNKYLYYSSLLFIAALFSKEVAAVTPALFILYYYINKTDEFSLNKLKLPFILWVSSILFYFYMRSGAIKVSYGDTIYNMDNLMANLPTVFEFISKFILGAKLSPMADFSTFVTFSGFLILAGLSFYLYFYKNADFKIISFGILWIFFFLVPTLMFKHGLGEHAYSYLEHRAYLPILGFVFILVPILSNFLDDEKKNNRKYLLLLLIAFYAFHTYSYSTTYKNPFTLYGRVIEENPKSAMAYYNRGVSFRTIGKAEESFRDINKSLELYPDYLEALVDRGVAYQQRGEYRLSAKDLERAIKIQPTNYKAIMTLGVVAGIAHDYKTAIKLMNRALSLNNRDIAALNNRGYTYLLLKDYDKAMADFSAAININPNFADAHHNRGNLYYTLGRNDLACKDWVQAAKFGNAQSAKNLENLCK
ncbi:MAG TPA: tetratricopeptide repeat protein [Candidatus Kapabacteria bacterium]|nr:tetratricopeptide repeat protein [Candidatus Kapabacteria bacterium]